MKSLTPWTKMALIAGSLIAMPSVSNACTGVTLVNGGPPAITYDPFSGSNANTSFVVQVSNTCGPGVQSGQRDVKIWFVDEIPPTPFDRRIGGALFDVRNNNNSVLNTSGDATPASLQLRYNANQGNQTGQNQYTFTVFIAGSQPGTTASRQINLRWSYENESGLQVEQVIPVPVQTNVTSGFQLSVAGTSGSAGTIDFGTFTGSAETRALMLRVGAVQPYRVSMESEQDGMLRRVTQCGTKSLTLIPSEQIAYSATFAGAPLSSTSDYIGNSGTLALPGMREDLPLVVTVPAFDLATKRAGQFCDVLRIRVKPQ